MTTITLTKPITWHEKSLTQLEIREPTGGDYFACGEPFTVVRNSNGSWYPVDNDDSIKLYIDKCLKIDGGSAILNVLSLADARALKRAIIDFFSEGHAAPSP